MSCNTSSNVNSIWLFIVGLIGLFIGLPVGYYCINKDYARKVENINAIEQENKELEVEIKHIDSLKNEEVIKVKGLDNDSTYKLFKQLVGADE